MNFVADESIDMPIVDRLRAEQHDVVAVTEVSPGLDDDHVLEIAARDGRILLTADKDFGELVYRLGRASAGVVLVRLAGLSTTAKATTTSDAIAAHQSELPGAFAVIEPGRIRIRKP